MCRGTEAEDEAAVVVRVEDVRTGCGACTVAGWSSRMGVVAVEVTELWRASIWGS
jgi:hypothetical protein